MLLFENVPATTPAIQQLIRELILTLPQLRVRQVPTRREDMRYFEYIQTKEYKELLRGIFVELARVSQKEQTCSYNTDMKGKRY